MREDSANYSSGDDYALEGFAAGAHGWVSGVANVAPGECVQLMELVERLSILQQRLFAEGERSLLLVLQGLDASGKDGVVRKVFTGVNPQGCRVVSFKAPTSTELMHDFLWRIHAALPERGHIGIFNRSHYEDIVTVRMLGLAPEQVWKRRPRDVNAFERTLTDEGTTIVQVTHSEINAAYGHRIVRLEDGWIVGGKAAEVP